MKTKPIINKAVIGLALAGLAIGAIFRGRNCNAAIIHPKAPDGGQQIVSKDLGAQSLKFLGVSRIEDLTIADPFQNYSVWPTNLASGQLLFEAKPTSWRYLLMKGTNAVGSEDLGADEKTGKPLVFYSLEKGDRMLAAVRIAEQLPQTQKSDYELRYLEIAPVEFVAIWLHGQSDDIIIPLPPTFGRWKAYQPYSESQMAKLLKPEVEKKLKEPPGTVD